MSIVKDYETGYFMSEVEKRGTLDHLLEDTKFQEQAYLEKVNSHSFRTFRDSCDIEDEEISADEEAAVREADADIAANGTISHQQVRVMLGLSEPP